MKITFAREKLLHSFQMAATVAPTRSPKPILQKIKLVASETMPTADLAEHEPDSGGPQGMVTLMATDTEVGIRLVVPAVDVQAAGAVVLPQQRVGSILRESSDDTLTMESTGTQIHIGGQRSHFHLAAEDPQEFPEVAPFASAAYHEVPARLLRELIRRTLFAADTETSRFALGGVLLICDEQKITAVGTDGRRLAKMEGPAISVGGHLTGESSTIVPARAMQLIERVFGDADAELKLAVSENDLIVSTSRTTIYARLVEGRFPRWQDVLVERPEAMQIQLTVGPFYSAIRQASIVASEESRGIDFDFSQGMLVVQSKTAEVGDSRVELPIAYDGGPRHMILDHRFVSDFLKVLHPEETLELGVVDNDHPADFRTKDGYHYVVMPLSREQQR